MAAIATWQVQMDTRVVLTAAYAAGVSTFTYTFPYWPAKAVYLPTGVAYSVVSTSDTTGTVTGVDLSGGQSVLGTYAPLQVDLSEVIAREGEDGGGKPELDLGVLLKGMTLLHRKAGGFSVQVANVRSTLWPTTTSSWAPDLTAAADRAFNRFRVPIRSVAEDVTVSLVESTWKPVQIAGLETELEVMETLR